MNSGDGDEFESLDYISGSNLVVLWSESRIAAVIAPTSSTPQLSISAVPEPSSTELIGLGVLASMLRHRR